MEEILECYVKRGMIMLLDDIQNTLSTEEVANILRVAKSTVRNILKDGALPYIRISGRNRVFKSDLETYLKNQYSKRN